MSIASEITRLQGAKTSLKTAIEAKGVTVPSATLLDGYADLVASISGGSGGILDDILEVVSYVTPEEDVGEIEFSWDAHEGYYFIVSNSPGTPTIASQQNQAQIISTIGIPVFGLTTQTVRSQYCICSLKTPSASTAVDYWTPIITLGASTLSAKVNTNGTIKFLEGFTYYLCRVKGM